MTQDLFFDLFFLKLCDGYIVTCCFLRPHRDAARPAAPRERARIAQ